MDAAPIKVSLQLDVLTLGVYVRSKGTPHGDGAYARFKGLPLRDADPRWVNGWQWADRIIQGLEKVHGGSADSIWAERDADDEGSDGV